MDTHLVAANERGLRGDGPVALRSMQIGVADTGALHLEKTFTGLEIVGLGHGPVVDDLESCTSRANDGGLHGLGDGVGRHGRGADVGCDQLVEGIAGET